RGRNARFQAKNDGFHYLPDRRISLRIGRPSVNSSISSTLKFSLLNQYAPSPSRAQISRSIPRPHEEDHARATRRISKAQGIGPVQEALEWVRDRNSKTILLNSSGRDIFTI